MIEMLEGVPGSGKSYHAVAEKFLPWVRQGRRIYIYVEGIYLDRLAVFEGVPVAQLENQITVWWTKDDVLSGLLTVEPGSGVILDEVQTLFRAREKQDPQLLRWLETHRHRGIDLVLMCQHASQCTLGLMRLVEVTTKFRRLDRFGVKGRYQAAVRGNPEETDVIRIFMGRYDPKIYAYYSSYATAAIKETQRGGSMLKSPTMILGLLGLIGSAVWLGWGAWLNGAKPSQALSPSVSVVPPASMRAADASASRQAASAPATAITPLRIEGGMQMKDNNPDSWLWVTEGGELLSDADVASRTGAPVSSAMVRGVRVLRGPGIIWGGRPSAGPPAVSEWPTDEEAPKPQGPIEEFHGNGVDLLKTPPSLL